uniref:hypothetical protein n=1 Tax=Aeromonas lacus TaxID=558884 RepID=UPI001377BBF2
VLNHDIAQTVVFSVTSTSPTTQSGEFGASSQDVVFDYKLKVDYDHMMPPSVYSLMQVTSERRKAYLVSRATDALSVQVKVSGNSQAKPKRQPVCAFSLSDNDEHIPVPSWLEYEQGGAGKWAKRNNDCSGSPLRIDDGYWQQTAFDPAQGSKSMELNSRLRFVMNDGSSGFTLERNRFWAGNATGKGTISFELLFQNKAA